MFNLKKTPYVLDDNSAALVKLRLEAIEERISLLRHSGTMTEQTLRDYYGEKRFEQVAESNAIEGCTLSAGETELAVLKGVTISGHDPAFVRDAVALDLALVRITDLARNSSVCTDISQLTETHRLLLGDRPGAGVFRNERVLIRGSKHTPPKTKEDVTFQMTEWQVWSLDNPTLPAPIRSAVLHAWLTHIHPFIDGNGRTARAIGNLELIRAGYPPIIIKKKERDQYLEALAESDDGGDIRAFIELIIDRIEGSLTGLELSARKRQGYNPAIAKIRLLQEKQLRIWETSIKLLASILELRISNALETVRGTCVVKLFDDPLDLDDYTEVCAGQSVPRSWAFIIRINVPGFSPFEKLAYVGHRSARMYNYLGQQGGPSLYWSSKNPDGFPKWISDCQNSPYAIEISSKIGDGDIWYVNLANTAIESAQTTELAERIADALLGQVYSSKTGPTDAAEVGG